MPPAKKTESTPRLSPVIDTRKFLFTLAGISAAALVLRLILGWELSDIRSVTEPLSVTDMATYRQQALDICHGTFPEYYYYQPFYSAVFLPIVYTILGTGAWAVIATQTALGAAAVWLTGLSAARLFGRKAGIAAAVLLCLSRFHIFYTPFCLIAVLQAFWMACLVYMGIRCWQRPTVFRWLGLALCCSLATLTRGNVLLLVPGYIALLAWRLRQRPLRALLLALAFLMVLYLPQLPFSLANFRHYGRWTGPSSAQDAVLALGNTPEAPPGGLEYPLTYKQWMADASREPGERIPVTRRILNWAGDEPILFFDLKFRTFLLFWNRMEIPNNVSLQNEGQASRLLKFPLLLNFGVLGTIGLLGLILSLKRHSPSRWLLLFTVAAYCGATVLFYILTRFRVPILPALCLYGGHGIVKSFTLLRNKNPDPEQTRRRLLSLGLAWLVCVFFVSVGFQRYQSSIEKPLMRALRPNGMAVDTDEKAVVYDHGPLTVGGFTFISVPPNGLVFEKTLSTHPHNLCPDTPGETVLRIPLVLSKDATFEFTLTGLEQDRSKKPRFERENGVPWFTVPVAGAQPQQPPVTFTVRLTPKTGEVSLGIDVLRDYGRTRFRTADSTENHISAEAAVELEWRKEKASR